MEDSAVEPLDPPGPCQAGAAERRVMCRSLRLWEELRQGDRLPHPDSLAPDRHAELAPFLYLIRLAEPPRQSVFEQVGSVLAGICHLPPLGRSLAEVLPPTLLESTVSYAKGALQYRRPLADSGTMLIAGQREIRYRNALMPLVDEADRITHLLGGFSFCYAED